MLDIPCPFVVPGIADHSRAIPVEVGNGIAPRLAGRSVVIAAQEVLPRLPWLTNRREVTVIPVASAESTKSVAFRDACIAEHGVALAGMDSLIVVGGGTVLNLGTALAAKLRDLAKVVGARQTAAFSIAVVPTTLLAMADAAYGSSGLLNDGAAKNAIRIKLDPDAIVIDEAHLPTLPVAEKKRGLAECLKHAVLQEAEGGAAPSIDQCLSLLRAAEPDDHRLLSCVLQTIRARADIAAAVNAGNELAASLPSYGHLDVEPREAASSYRLAHGDAVLLGLIVELTLSGLAPAADRLRRVVPFTPLGAALDAIDFDCETMCRAYRQSARPRFRAGPDRYRIIRLGAIGAFAEVGRDTPIEFLEFPFRTLYDEARRQLALARHEVRS
jgi:3-dehydroquinate synthetase